MLNAEVLGGSMLLNWLIGITFLVLVVGPAIPMARHDVNQVEKKHHPVQK
jgi:hypothetical protein